jgi:hypothetical protein
MIAMDTDVLAISLFYHHDKRFAETAGFLRDVPKPTGLGIYNLMELCGIASGHGITARQLFLQYLSSPDIQVLYPPVVLHNHTLHWQHYIQALLARVERSMRLGDAAVLWTVESCQCESLITWNKRHFDGKTSLSVMTPGEWLFHNSANE